jgi:hypothetical protein
MHNRHLMRGNECHKIKSLNSRQPPAFTHAHTHAHYTYMHTYTHTKYICTHTIYIYRHPHYIYARTHTHTIYARMHTHTQRNNIQQCIILGSPDEYACFLQKLVTTSPCYLIKYYKSVYHPTQITSHMSTDTDSNSHNLFNRTGYSVSTIRKTLQ